MTKQEAKQAIALKVARMEAAIKALKGCEKDKALNGPTFEAAYNACLRASHELLDMYFCPGRSKRGWTRRDLPKLKVMQDAQGYLASLVLESTFGPY